MLTPLYAPRPSGPMRVAGFMSGSGTNLVKILEWQARLEKEPGGAPFRVVVIFSDNPASSATRIGEEYGVPVLVEDILSFYRSRGHRTKKDLSLRPAFDRRIVDLLVPHAVETLVLAGYMSVVTRPLLEAFPGRIVNVHPADLRIREAGKRKYTGDHAVRDAIRAGEQEIRSTTHLVREEVDGGEILMVSAPVPVTLPEGVGIPTLSRPEHSEELEEIAGRHQERLKREGDWIVLPLTLERLSLGRYAMDGAGRICLDGEPLEDFRAS
jgi:folate-dependent phosphoribosylglycinamide formyltransferase PurN